MTHLHTLWPVPPGHTRFILVRHGETDWNRQRRFQGFTDVALNSKGKAQAQALSMRFASLGEQIGKASVFDVCYTSDLSRAHETALALSNSQSHLYIKKELRERHYGDMSGLTGDEMSQHFPEAFKGVAQRVPDQAIPGGESLQTFYNRIIDSFLKIKDNHPEQTVLIVAHGGVLDCIYRHARQIPLEPKRDWLLPNTALNIIDHTPENQYLVQLWADVSHTQASDWAKNLDEVDGRVA